MDGFNGVCCSGVVWVEAIWRCSVSVNFVVTMCEGEVSMGRVLWCAEVDEGSVS